MTLRVALGCAFNHGFIQNTRDNFPNLQSVQQPGIMMKKTLEYVIYKSDLLVVCYNLLSVMFF